MGLYRTTVLEIKGMILKQFRLGQGIEHFHMMSLRPYWCSNHKSKVMLVSQTNPVGVDLPFLL